MIINNTNNEYCLFDIVKALMAVAFNNKELCYDDLSNALNKYLSKEVTSSTVFILKDNDISGYNKQLTEEQEKICTLNSSARVKPFAIDINH